MYHRPRNVLVRQLEELAEGSVLHDFGKGRIARYDVHTLSRLLTERKVVVLSTQALLDILHHLRPKPPNHAAGASGEHS